MTRTGREEPLAGFDGFGASAAQRTIAVVGDAWTLRILRSVFRGQRRYKDFIEEFRVSRAVLSDRLARLVAWQVLERHAPEGRHPEYRLSERGLDLWSLFLAMWLWETEWGTAQAPDSWAPDLPRAQPAHTVCGHAMWPQLRCQACHGLVTPFETRAEPLADTQTALPAAAAVDDGMSSGFRRARPSTAGTGPAAQPTVLGRIVGDRWSSAVIAAAFRGARLFSQFEDQLRIGPAQLSDRLAELQQLGVLGAHAYAGTRREYRLTKAGIALFPITLELMRWGRRWVWPDSAGLAVHHLPCGHTLDARWHCGHCAQVLARDTVRFS